MLMLLDVLLVVLVVALIGTLLVGLLVIVGVLEDSGIPVGRMVYHTMWLMIILGTGAHRSDPGNM